MKYLENINSPTDLKKLDFKQIEVLADEIREFLIETIAKTGGHLSSNLGVVELSLALNYCFDFLEDRIIWDVGHQCYTHKILTGRRKFFETLRQKEGLSGFPKCSESAYDHFNTGHSSTSISAALGFATARDLLGKDFSVVSVIGDGAMTGGLVFEAMNNAGVEHKKMLIILNDNQMSISENVGSISRYLSRLSSSPQYIGVKGDIKKFLKKLDSFGDKINSFLIKTKEGVKHALLPSVIFEQLGIKYIGVIDGHNIRELINVIQKIKNIDAPVLLHVMTKKGYGYIPAEKFPLNYHGVTPFNKETGELEQKKEQTYTDTFGKFMVKEANKNKKLVAITAAMPDGTGLSFFSKLYKDRFFDVGIAEQHAAVFAAALAKEGFIPVFAVYSTFLQRAYDQIVHDVCLQNLHVVFAIDRAGIVGEDGDTHQGIFDLSYLSHIPNLTILAPKNKNELCDMLDFAINNFKAPIAIRYPKGEAKETYKELNTPILYGKSELIKKGEKIAIIAVGSMIETAKFAYDKLALEGYNPSLINARFISPIDEDLIFDIREDYDYIFTIEDNVFSGGFGAKLNALLIKNGIFNKKIYNKALPDTFIAQGKISEIYKQYEMDGYGFYRYIKDKIKEL